MGLRYLEYLLLIVKEILNILSVICWIFGIYQCFVFICKEAHSWKTCEMQFEMVFDLPVASNMTEGLCSVMVSDGGEGQEGSVAGTGHAHSVPAAGGPGHLHHDPHREPQRQRLRLWSHCKCLLILQSPSLSGHTPTVKWHIDQLNFLKKVRNFSF